MPHWYPKLNILVPSQKQFMRVTPPFHRTVQWVFEDARNVTNLINLLFRNTLFNSNYRPSNIRSFHTYGVRLMCFFVTVSIQVVESCLVAIFPIHNFIIFYFCRTPCHTVCIVKFAKLGAIIIFIKNERHTGSFFICWI